MIRLNLLGENIKTSTEECSARNEAHVSTVRKWTFPGSLLQSGGGAGGAGFLGLEPKQNQEYHSLLKSLLNHCDREMIVLYSSLNSLFHES